MEKTCIKRKDVDRGESGDFKHRRAMTLPALPNRQRMQRHKSPNRTIYSTRLLSCILFLCFGLIAKSQLIRRMERPKAKCLLPKTTTSGQDVLLEPTNIAYTNHKGPNRHYDTIEATFRRKETKQLRTNQSDTCGRVNTQRLCSISATLFLEPLLPFRGPPSSQTPLKALENVHLVLRARHRRLKGTRLGWLQTTNASRHTLQFGDLLAHHCLDSDCLKMKEVGLLLPFQRQHRSPLVTTFLDDFRLVLRATTFTLKSNRKMSNTEPPPNTSPRQQQPAQEPTPTTPTRQQHLQARQQYKNTPTYNTSKHGPLFIQLDSVSEPLLLSQGSASSLVPLEEFLSALRARTLLSLRVEEQLSNNYATKSHHRCAFSRDGSANAFGGKSMLEGLGEALGDSYKDAQRQQDATNPRTQADSQQDTAQHQQRLPRQNARPIPWHISRSICRSEVGTGLCSPDARSRTKHVQGEKDDKSVANVGTFHIGATLPYNPLLSTPTSDVQLLWTNSFCSTVLRPHWCTAVLWRAFDWLGKSGQQYMSSGYRFLLDWTLVTFDLIVPWNLSFPFQSFAPSVLPILKYIQLALRPMAVLFGRMTEDDEWPTGDCLTIADLPTAMPRRSRQLLKQPLTASILLWNGICVSAPRQRRARVKPLTVGFFLLFLRNLSLQGSLQSSVHSSILDDVHLSLEVPDIESSCCLEHCPTLIVDGQLVYLLEARVEATRMQPNSATYPQLGCDEGDAVEQRQESPQLNPQLNGQQLAPSGEPPQKTPNTQSQPQPQQQQNAQAQPQPRPQPQQNPPHPTRGQSLASATVLGKVSGHVMVAEPRKKFDERFALLVATMRDLVQTKDDDLDWHHANTHRQHPQQSTRQNSHQHPPEFQLAIHRLCRSEYGTTLSLPVAFEQTEDVQGESDDKSADGFPCANHFRRQCCFCHPQQTNNKVSLLRTKRGRFCFTATATKVNRLLTKHHRFVDTTDFGQHSLATNPLLHSTNGRDTDLGPSQASSNSPQVLVNADLILSAEIVSSLGYHAAFWTFWTLQKYCQPELPISILYALPSRSGVNIGGGLSSPNWRIPLEARNRHVQIGCLFLGYVPVFAKTHVWIGRLVLGSNAAFCQDFLSSQYTILENHCLESRTNSHTHKRHGNPLSLFWNVENLLSSKHDIFSQPYNLLENHILESRDNILESRDNTQSSWCVAANSPLYLMWTPALHSLFPSPMRKRPIPLCGTLSAQIHNPMLAQRMWNYQHQFQKNAQGICQSEAGTAIDFPTSSFQINFVPGEIHDMSAISQFSGFSCTALHQHVQNGSLFFGSGSAAILFQHNPILVLGQNMPSSVVFFPSRLFITKLCSKFGTEDHTHKWQCGPFRLFWNAKNVLTSKDHASSKSYSFLEENCFVELRHDIHSPKHIAGNCQLDLREQDLLSRIHTLSFGLSTSDNPLPQHSLFSSVHSIIWNAFTWLEEPGLCYTGTGSRFRWMLVSCHLRPSVVYAVMQQTLLSQCSLFLRTATFWRVLSNKLPETTSANWSLPNQPSRRPRENHL